MCHDDDVVSVQIPRKRTVLLFWRLMTMTMTEEIMNNDSQIFIEIVR